MRLHGRESLLHVVLQLFPDRGFDGHVDGDGQHDEREHDQEGDEPHVDQAAYRAEDAEGDAEYDAEDQHHEKHGPFAAVGGVVRSLDGLHRVLALLDEEVVGERPGQREHDARDVEECEGDQDRQDHQTRRDEVFAHVAAVLAVEDARRVYHLALGQLCGQERDGDRTARRPP